MSTVAKILVVLNFVLAAVFLGSAAAIVGHADNWKIRHDNKVKEYEVKLDTANKELAAEKGKTAELSTKLNTAQDERNLAREKADTLQTAYDALKKSYDELNASCANMSKALQVAQTTIQNGRTLVDQLQNERQTLIDNLTRTSEEKLAAVKMQNQLEQNLQNLEMQLKDTQAKLSSSDEGLQRTTFRLEAILRKNPGIEAGAEQPPLRGKVLAADNANNIVVISIGAEDGVKEGFQYTIARGNSFVAVLQVTNVQAKMASGQVITGLSKGPVNVGDEALTR